MATYSVSSSTELKAALNTASGGDLIKLAAGDYGNFSMRRTNYDSEVTIESADADDPAVFNNINITSSSNITFDSLLIDFTPTENTVEWSTAFRAVQGVSNITLRNSKIEGGDSIAGVPPGSDPGEQGKHGILGEPIGRAITVSGTNLTIENNEVTHFKNGIVMGGTDINILDNDVHGLRTSPVRGGGSDVVIDGNYFHDSKPWNMGGKGDHGNYVHFWTQPDGEPKKNITITNNVFSDENGGSLLGIYLDDNKNDVGYKNIVVENNVIHSRTGQAVRFENVSDASIARNTILKPDDAEHRGTPLVFTDGTKGIHLEENIVSTFFSASQQDSLAENGFSFNNNLDVDYKNTEAANHIGRILTDSRLEGSGLWERAVVPGSAADGLGSKLMHLDDRPDMLTPVFEVERAGEEDGTMILRADLSRGPDGAVTDPGARFIWDFGDGTGATGPLVRHSYSEAGRYEATLTVVMPDGTKAEAVSEIGIMGSDILSYDPQSGLFQAEGYGATTAIADSDKASVDLGGGQDRGVDLGGPGVQVGVGQEHLSRLFGADSFDMSMTLRADTLGSTGEVARVHGNFILSVAPRGEVSLHLQTDKESKTLTTTNVTVNDGADHTIRTSLDGQSNSLMIYVDGELAGATEIDGAMREDYPRSLVFGNPWGKPNFDGKLTAFELEADNRDFPVYDGASEDIPEDAVPVDELPVVDESPEETTEPDAPPSGPPSDTGVPDETPQNNDTPQQDQPQEPVDDASIPPDAPVYTADLAHADKTESGIKLVDDAHIVEKDDGRTAVSLDGADDFVALGRIKELESSQEFNLSLDFQRSDVDGGAERMIWNHMKFGVTLRDDAMSIFVANNDAPSHEGFEIEEAGIDDLEKHSLNIAVDAGNDRLQVMLDGEVVLDEQDADLDFVGNGGHEWGWTIGSPWNRYYEGSVSNFELDDQAVFAEASSKTPGDVGPLGSPALDRSTGSGTNETVAAKDSAAGGTRDSGDTGAGADSSLAAETPATASMQDVLETGTLTLNHKAQTVTLEQSYETPVVVAHVATENGGQPVNVRVSGVSGDQLTLQLQEPNYLDGRHANETVNYMVVEAGTWALPDGTLLEAGTTESDKLSSQGFESVAFNAAFDTTPTVLSQVQSRNGGDFVTTRQRDADEAGFQLTMQEEEARNDGRHLTETLGWVAIEPGSGTAGDTDWHAGSVSGVTDATGTVGLGEAMAGGANVIAALSSFNGGNSAWARGSASSEDGFAVSVEEETSRDRETRHIAETVDYFAFSDAGVATAYDYDDLDTQPVFVDDALVI